MFPSCTPEDCSVCPERMICHCMQVTESEVMEAISERNISDLRQLKQATGAGDACMCCHQELRRFLASLECVPCT